MKKLIIVLAVGIIATEAVAQSNKKTATSADVKEMPAPAPTPAEEMQFTPPEIVKNTPKPPAKPSFTPPVIVNEKGYTITVQSTKDEPVILLRKKGITQKIRMSVWNAKPQYFENKYGQLPPPPPPAPQPLSVPPAPVKE
jgi:hypothetical protein